MEFQIEARGTWDIRNTRCRGCICRSRIQFLSKYNNGLKNNWMTKLNSKNQLKANCFEEKVSRPYVELG